MNIFALDDSPILAAQWQHDRHVVKMILESAQMLSTSVPEMVAAQYRPLLYKQTHLNHPCNIWVRESQHNVAWLILHGNALVREYHRRFQRVHATHTLLQGFLNGLQAKLGIERMTTRDGVFASAALDFASQHTPFAICMPDEYKVGFPMHGWTFAQAQNNVATESYRTLYRESKIFQDHVKWTRCDSIPDFLFDGEHTTRVDDRLASLVTAHFDQVSPPRVTIPDDRPIIPATIRRFGVATK